MTILANVLCPYPAPTPTRTPSPMRNYLKSLLGAAIGPSRPAARSKAPAKVTKAKAVQSSAATPATQPIRIAYELGSNAPTVTGCDELLAGYVFSATLQIRTPLHILERHLTTAPADGPLWDYRANSADMQADPHNMHGIWLAYTGTHRPSPVASDIGPVPKGGIAYAEFLKAFRKIVESNRSPSDTAFHLDALKTKEPAWATFDRKLRKTYTRKLGDTPKTLSEMWFRLQLQALPGIGPKAAKALFDAGHLDIYNIRHTTDDALLAVPGITRATLKRLHTPTPPKR